MTKWHEGRTYEEIYGPEHAARIRRKLADSHRDQVNPFAGMTYEQRYGPERAAELRAKVSASMAGKKKSEEARAHIAEAVRKRCSVPMAEDTRQKLLAANTGRVLTEEHRRKIGDSRRIHPLEEARGYTTRYKAWRNAVLERDAHKCQSCGGSERLHAHHLKPWRDYPSLRFDIGNGQTVCCHCHHAVEARQKAARSSF